MITMIFLLFCGHALADYALQSDFMANNKNRNFEPKGYDPAIHGAKQVFWPYVLIGHSLIHGLFVYLITGFVWLGIAETVAHAVIDFGKCEKWYGIHADQWFHFGCKVLWAAIAIFFILTGSQINVNL